MLNLFSNKYNHKIWKLQVKFFIVKDLRILYIIQMLFFADIHKANSNSAYEIIVMYLDTVCIELRLYVLELQ